MSIEAKIEKLKIDSQENAKRRFNVSFLSGFKSFITEKIKGHWGWQFELRLAKC